MKTKTKFAMLLVSFFLISSMMIAGNVTATSSVNVDQNRESTIIYALPYKFSEYSPWTADSYATQQWVSAVYSGLLARESGTRDWTMDLAASMPTQPDPSNDTYFQVKLKEGLRFNNNNSLTAQDVVFSYQAALTPAISQSAYGFLSTHFVSNSSVYAVDDYTIEFVLNNTYAFVNGLFTQPIIDQQVWQGEYDACVGGDFDACDWDAADGSDIVGTSGPFQFDSFDATNQVFTVVKNPYWYDAANVNLEKIIYLFIEDKAAAISELAAGRIDIMDSQYVPGLEELNGISGIVEKFVGDPAHQEIGINHNNGYFGNGSLVPDTGANIVSTDDDDQARFIRQAMSHIVARNFFVDEVMDGLASPAASTMPSASAGWDASIEADPFNITRAKELMEMAGYDYSDLGAPDADGVYSNFFFNMTVLAPNTNPARNQWSAAWKDELPKIGIEVLDYVNTGWENIGPRTWNYNNGTEAPSYDNGGFDVLFVGYSWGLDWDPTGLYTESGLCGVGDCSNFYNYKNATVWQMITDYTTELDPNARDVAASILQEAIHYDLPVIPILYPQSHWAWGSNVAGIDALLISQAAQPWNEVSGGRVDVTTTSTVSQTQTDTDTIIQTSVVENTATEQVTITAEGPIEVLPIVLGISSVFVAVFVRRRR